MITTLYKPQTPMRQEGQEDREKQQRQWQAVRDYAQAHPGLSHRSAYHILMQDRPELFSDESGQTAQEAEDLQHSNQKKQDRIHAEIKKMRTGPDGEMKMTFSKAWDTLRQQKPGLFNFDEAPVSSRPYAQQLPGTQQPASSMLRVATVRAEKAIRDGAAYIEVSSEDYQDLLAGKYD
jgi:hypothetical protein